MESTWKSLYVRDTFNCNEQYAIIISRNTLI